MIQIFLLEGWPDTFYMAATGGDIVISTIFFFTGAVLIVRFGVAVCVLCVVKCV